MVKKKINMLLKNKIDEMKGKKIGVTEIGKKLDISPQLVNYWTKHDFKKKKKINDKIILKILKNEKLSYRKIKEKYNEMAKKIGAKSVTLPTIYYYIKKNMRK